MNEESKSSFQWSHVSLPCTIRMLLHHLWMIAASAAIFAMTVSLFLTWVHVPEYHATMTYAVTSRSTSSVINSNLTATREVASVLTELLESDIIHEAIAKQNPALDGFDGTISASQIGDSNFIVVSATASTPQDAFMALDALVDTLPTVADFISGRNVLNVMRNPTVSSVATNVVDSNSACATAALIGAALMIALLCYLSIRAETIQTRTGARQLLDAPIIASICHEQKNRTLKTLLQRSNRQVQVFSPVTSFTYTEQISAVCSQMEHEASARGRKVFLITGVGENEGKSTVSGNVAAALALKGYKVALVDCDLRKPALSRFFTGQYFSTLPLNKMLAKPYTRDNLLECMVRHPQMDLYMLFPINGDSRCAELLSSDTMTAMIHQLRVFDYVIIDSPPMSMFPDAETLADMVDASMLVVRQDYTAACDINDAIDTLRTYKGGFLGVILNDMMESMGSFFGLTMSSGKVGSGTRYSHGGRYSHSSSHDSGGSKSGRKDV